MRLLQVIFVILWVLGYLGNGILFLYIEWSFVRQSFIQVFNPFLQLQILGVLLTTPLFWVFLAMALVGHYAVIKIEGYLEQKLNKNKAATVASPTSQPLQERQPSPSSSSRDELPCSAPPQPLSSTVSELTTGSLEPQIKLLEWAIQSSQKVRFSYEELYGYRSNCTVTPISLKTLEQALCLEGYSYQRGAKRTFEVKRMQDLKIVPANEPNPEAGTSQPAKPTRNDPEVVSPSSKAVEEPQLIPPSPPASPDPTPSKPRGISQEVIARPYITFSTDELEKLATSEWNNARGLSEIHYELEFRSRKKALDLRERIAERLTQLKGAQFSWSATTAKPSSQNVPIDLPGTPEEGLLKLYGYKVGMNGLPESERRKILDMVFLRPLFQIDNAAYLSEWGEPNSAKRLQKLAKTIAAFTRNAKRRSRGSFSQAIQDWESDLAYLKRTYYNNRFSFQYPRAQ